ncbi:MAG TPA: Gfo/Idh/MocA family oxidoreductase [Terriglobia bacterium]|jgi:predicted dehydrogenase|nr:Gfo/Idh/MocA family oxidoreductase [Terriglobia bacterium]
MPDVNIAILGYKFMGRAHSNAYRQVSHFFPGKLTPRMKVICGRDREAAEAAARQLGWEEVETDWRKVVERKDIDVIDISTPGYLHHEQALAAAAAGKHIICEKPLANTLADAKDMLRAVQKAGVKHMLMHNYRKIPAVALVRRLIDEGRLGVIYHYHGAYLQDWIIDPQFPLVWRLQKKLAGAGALGDIGSHAIDLGRYLNAEFNSVAGQMTTFIKERPLVGEDKGQRKVTAASATGKVTVDDDTNFLARFANGSVGVFESSRFAGGRKNYNTFQIYGSKGSVAFNLERMNELEFYDREDPQQEQGYKTISVTESVHPYVGAWWPPGHIIGYEHTFVHAVHDFLVALENDTLPSPNFTDGVKNQAVLEAIERSAKSGKWEKP